MSCMRRWFCDRKAKEPWVIHAGMPSSATSAALPILTTGAWEAACGSKSHPVAVSTGSCPAQK